jgi:glutamate carboxypeptidase
MKHCVIAVNLSSRMSDARRWLEPRLSEMEDWLSRLVTINSFSANREGLLATAEVLKSLFAIEGLQCEVVPSVPCGAHLVFQSSGSSASPIALLGHFDTVFPPDTFGGYVTDGSLRRGPGVLDMKGGLVVMAYGLRALTALRPWQQLPPLKVVLNADEEVGSFDSRALIAKHVASAQAALVFESGRADDGIVTSRKGTGNCNVLALGKAAHAGNEYFEGRNAIWALSRFVDGAQQLSSRETGVTVSVGKFHGGTARNTVAAEASAELDLRFVAAADVEATWRALRELKARVENELPGTSLTLTDLGGRPPMERSDGNVSLSARYGTFAKAEGLGNSESVRQGGGSDANISASLGVPSIDGLGPRGRFFHSHNEYIEIDTLVPKAAALASFLASYS